jgi:hypothetical protein
MWLAAPSSESSRVVPLGFSYAQLSEGQRRERLDDARAAYTAPGTMPRSLLAANSSSSLNSALSALA